VIDRARILHWIRTGENEFKLNFVRHEAVGRTSIGLEGDQGPFAASAPESSAHRQDSELTPLESSESESENSTSNGQDDLLVSCEDDPLIPYRLEGGGPWNGTLHLSIAYRAEDRLNVGAGSASMRRKVGDHI
jgi:hypothetical protein